MESFSSGPRRTRFLPLITTDSEVDPEDDDMPPGILVGPLPAIPAGAVHDGETDDMPPGIVIDTSHMYLEELVEDDDMPAGVIVDDGNATVSESSTPSITFPTHTSPGAFNYTFLPDMSLATATTATSSTSEQARTARGGPGEASYSESGARTSGTILSVAYPTHPSSYSPRIPSSSPLDFVDPSHLGTSGNLDDSANGSENGHNIAFASPVASYQNNHIPRPPNAFILFRSAFIKSRKISSEIEGNHSTLSKIIGRVWRNLPPSERAEWEARARIAQADHRLRYPDWRFSPAGADGRGKRGRGRGRGRNKGGGEDGGGRGRGRLKIAQRSAVSGSSSAVASGSGHAQGEKEGAGSTSREREAEGTAHANSIPASGSSTSRKLGNEDSERTSHVQNTSDSDPSSQTVVLGPKTAVLEDSAPPVRSGTRTDLPVRRDVPPVPTNASGETKKGKARERGVEPTIFPRNNSNSAREVVSTGIAALTSTNTITSPTIAEAETRRVDAIVHMLAQGYEGKELEVALKNWEDGEKGQMESRGWKGSSDSIDAGAEMRVVNVEIVEAKLVQVADQWNEERGRTPYSSSRTPMNNERVQDVSGSSRSTSSNETERERNRAGGEWGMLNVGADHGMNQPTFPESPGSPLTRMFLKRSRSEPAAPRPNRPRLQLSTGDREDSEERPEYEYEHGYGGIDDWESLEIDGADPRPLERPLYPTDSFSTGLESSIPPAGRQSFTRSHMYAVPGSNAQTLPAAYNAASSSSGLVPGSWTSSHLQRNRSFHSRSSPSVSTSSSASSPPSTASPLESSVFSFPSTYSHISLSQDAIVEGERRESRSPVARYLHSTPLSPVAVQSPGIRLRARAWTTRSFPSTQSLILRHESYPPTAGYFNTQQRSRSRGSPPPSSPASPSGDTIIPPIRGRGLSSRPTHRKMPTWGGGWTYSSAGSSTEASPVPSTASVSPHRRLNASPSAGERVLTWQEVEDERRDLVRIDYDRGRRVAVVGDEVVPIADLKESVDVEELASTAGMGWQQHSISLHSAETQDSSPFADDEARLWLTGDETVGRSIQETQLRYLTESSPAISWTTATSGHAGFVTSIVDPHLDLYRRSPKTIEEHDDHGTPSRSDPSLPHSYPQHPALPGSSYSSLSGWAGGGEQSGSQNKSVYQSQSGSVGEPVMTVPHFVLSSYSMYPSKSKEAATDDASSLALAGSS
ncbi:hypothetical protein D9757_010558 [Collybiopsis confluens]|uniref:HMG box domain-containing protein n=1 Tax=Collybiopsis confluens TaxID=2823264 RepID=A0A8H5LXH0_9AGAR|nr:hypothetical protein D9757_010558 [Collybiopsis confluens]